MDSTIIIIGMISLIVLLLIVGAPLKPLRFVTNGTVKLAIGILFLFFFNVVGASLGLHIPINIYTALVTGFLGVPGLVSLAALHIFVIG